MKHLIVVGVLWMASSSDVSAQITDIHSRYGTSGSHFALPSNTQTLPYEATISGAPGQFQIVLDVYHNGVKSFTSTSLGSSSGATVSYACPVEMGTWGLATGDVVTFVLKVIDTATGETVATHTLIGDVVGP